MKHPFRSLLIAALACLCLSSVRAQNIEGQIIAAQYGKWRVQGIPQPTTGNSFNFVAAACSQIAGNQTFQAFQVGTPIEIFDADPNLNEVVTPSAVAATNQGCSITVTPTHTHNSFSLGSATGGLQEAINANLISPKVNTIVLTAGWYEHGGSSSVITSVQGNTNLNLVDVTKAPYDWYTWNGSVYVKVTFGGGSLPHTLDMLAGDNNGNAVGMPEKGTTLVIGTPNTGKVAWNEDAGLGLFDARDTKYGSGGILGSNPAQAMQDLRNDIICYQSITGLHAHVVFPPGQFKVGTAASPTLTLPTGAYYVSAMPSFAAAGTVFAATYSNTLAMHVENNLTATCSDGNVHTSTLGAGRLEGIGEFGCEEGGCVNVPGDTGSWPNGGPSQDGILIEESQGFVDMVGANFNGGSGVHVAGLDTEVGKLFANSNMGWYTFGNKVAGQLYNPTTDGWHCNAIVDGLDDHSTGTIETYGWNGSFVAPGAEYGHVCEVLWGGGDTNIGPVFINRGNGMGLVRLFANNAGRVVGGRIDAVGGEGIYVAGGGNTFTAIQNTTSCTGFGALTRGKIFGPFIATAGSGMTNGTYVVPAVNASGDTSGAGATLTVTVVGGLANSITVSNPGTSPYLATPSFTMTGTGGTPATIGAIAYTHCDYLETVSGSGNLNSFVGINNGYDSFFGANNATGFIWDAGGQNAYDRGTTGTFEKISGATNIPKGSTSHKDLLDPFVAGGGVAVTGPAVSFLGGNHFVSGDISPTVWSGPFVVENVMQDLWIIGGNANTTLPASSTSGAGPFLTCNGHDLNLVAAKQYHFLVYRDDNFSAPFLFVEQCDDVFEDYLQPGFVYLAANSALPVTDTQATNDVAGSVAVRPYPALPDVTLTSAGSGSSFSYCFVNEFWLAGGKQTTHSVCTSKTPPVTTTTSNNLAVHQSMPQNWTRYQVRLNSTTDPSFTPGVWYDVTSPNGLPQPVSPDFGGNFPNGLFITQKVPTDTSTIATANLGLNMTGTYNVSLGGVAVPASSATLCIKGQVIRDVVGGFDYTCDTEDHWKRAAVTWANF